MPAVSSLQDGLVPLLLGKPHALSTFNVASMVSCAWTRSKTFLVPRGKLPNPVKNKGLA